MPLASQTDTLYFPAEDILLFITVTSLLVIFLHVFITLICLAC
ncbi:hypothetical protein HMPREF3197_01765 [Klebsiella pneumoniae]|nr:hypothetical protein HMPREF9538_04938 [Klebsiella sp. MS 92-3]KXA27549.1 hypothetical protein HMPREF3197_01765 [Klebsiella pneumoniae]